MESTLSCGNKARLKADDVPAKGPSRRAFRIRSVSLDRVRFHFENIVALRPLCISRLTWQPAGATDSAELGQKLVRMAVDSGRERVVPVALEESFCTGVTRQPFFSLLFN